MNTVKTIFRVEFAGALRPWLELRDLLRVTGDEPSIEIQGSPIVLEKPKKRQLAILDVRGFTLEQEEILSPQENIKRVVDMMNTMDKVLSLPKISHLLCETRLVEPYALPFHELVILMKKWLFHPNLIVNSATDVALTVDQHEGTVEKHIGIGPMEAPQLKAMFVKWPPANLPDQFVFLLLRYKKTGNDVFDALELQGFLEAAHNWQTAQAEAIFAAFHQEGG